MKMKWFQFATFFINKEIILKYIYVCVYIYIYIQAIFSYDISKSDI